MRGQGPFAPLPRGLGQHAFLGNGEIESSGLQAAVGWMGLSRRSAQSRASSGRTQGKLPSRSQFYYY